MQPVLHFVVNNQIITRTDTFVPVRNSRNYLYAEFEFLTDDWAGKSRTALFRSGTANQSQSCSERQKQQKKVKCMNSVLKMIEKQSEIIQLQSGIIDTL